MPDAQNNDNPFVPLEVGTTRTTAMISDIHGNLEALTVVLDDIESRGIERIICLGDIIGYGPNPRECLDLVMHRCAWAMMGNHDFAALYEPTSFNVSAEMAAFWTRSQLESEPDDEARRRRFEYLGNLRIRVVLDHTLFVHASPRRPINEYVFPDDPVTAPGKIAAIFDRVDWRCFCGHTHVPGVFTDEPDFYPPLDLDGVYKFDAGEKCIINPGSVGQPRDRDTRASYCIFTETADDEGELGGQVEFVRVEYDIQSVIEKVKAIEDLSDFCGMRLLDGR